MDKNTGGPAFPHTDMEWVTEEQQWKKPASTGMTLRDYFAAKAIAGMLMAGDVGGEYVGYMECADWQPLAKHAYAIADAMLKARAA